MIKRGSSLKRHHNEKKPNIPTKLAPQAPTFTRLLSPQDRVSKTPTEIQKRKNKRSRCICSPNRDHQTVPLCLTKDHLPLQNTDLSTGLYFQQRNQKQAKETSLKEVRNTHLTQGPKRDNTKTQRDTNNTTHHGQICEREREWEERKKCMTPFVYVSMRICVLFFLSKRKFMNL